MSFKWICLSLILFGETFGKLNKNNTEICVFNDNLRKSNVEQIKQSEILRSNKKPQEIQENKNSASVV